MNKKRILIITQEMKPYLVLSEMARITNQLPVHLLNQGMEPYVTSADEFSRTITRELEVTGQLIRKYKIPKMQ